MTIRKNVLWKVPLFCFAAGLVAFRAAVFLISRFAIVTLPDGVITSDNTRVDLIYALILLATLLVGGLAFFRNMTRREIFLSAAILVAFDLGLTAVQLIFDLTTGPGAVPFLYLSQLFEWRMLIPQLLYRISDSHWLIAVVSALTPFLFVPFGRSE